MKRKKMSKRKAYLKKRWGNIMSRCYSKKHASYKRYGAKGIGVCEEWHDFEVFYKWACQHGLRRRTAIHRIHSNLDYNPNNCICVDKTTHGILHSYAYRK